MVELYGGPHFLWHLAKLFIGATEYDFSHYTEYGNPKIMLIVQCQQQEERRGWDGRGEGGGKVR